MCLGLLTALATALVLATSAAATLLGEQVKSTAGGTGNIDYLRMSDPTWPQFLEMPLSGSSSCTAQPAADSTDDAEAGNGELTASLGEELPLLAGGGG